MAERTVRETPGRLLLRFDADRSLGLGHAARAIALAEELGARLSTRPVVLARPDPVLERFLDGRAVELRPLLEPGYGLKAILPELESTAVVVSDTYSLDQDALDAIARTSARHLVVDDFARNGRWAGALVINPNVGAESFVYRGASRVLAGPRYALLRREVRAAFGRRRQIVAQGDRLLVCLGGGAWGVAGTSLLEAAAELTKAGVQVHAVTAESVPPGIQRVEPARLADELAWADVGLISGGVLKYEAAVAGLPAVLLAAVPHQQDVARAFAAGGAATYLGPLDQVDAAAAVSIARGLLDDSTAREEMVRTARALVDGRGVERAAEALLASN